MIFWLLAGAIGSTMANHALQLVVPRKSVTLGTALAYLLGVAAGPASVAVGLIWYACWLISPDQRYGAKWPDWWGRFRWKWHRAWRWCWHLGNPPKKEDWLSSWNYAPARWKQ